MAYLIMYAAYALSNLFVMIAVGFHDFIGYAIQIGLQGLWTFYVWKVLKRFIVYQEPAKV